MPSEVMIEIPPPEDISTVPIEEDVLTQINEQDVVSLDTLIALLPHYSWNQIFHTVDRLARARRIVLRRHRFDYTLFSNRFAS